MTMIKHNNHKKEIPLPLWERKQKLGFALLGKPLVFAGEGISSYPFLIKKLTHA